MGSRITTAIRCFSDIVCAQVGLHRQNKKTARSASLPDGLFCLCRRASPVAWRLQLAALAFVFWLLSGLAIGCSSCLAESSPDAGGSAGGSICGIGAGAAASAASGGATNNVGNEGVITAASGVTFTIYGIGLSSVSIKGATTGILLQAGKFPVAKKLSPGEKLELSIAQVAVNA